MAKAKLTVKQDKFCREYAKDGNATRAAKQAGYSHRSARVIGPENLSKPVVAAEIRRHRQRTAERLDVSREKLVNDAAHDAEAASSNGDWGAANANRTFVAKALGYHVERSMSVHVDVSLAHLDALKQLVSERNKGMIELTHVSRVEPVEHHGSAREPAAWDIDSLAGVDGKHE